ncbi:LCP family protein required for cell wall assembly [Peptoniphilus olsenii]|uniref:LCP family protein required for cell wall assembly n=1 Tax=Peptoniphilus olsenii TaxID=411570 RepID=A0ABV2J8P8_9FIRM
MKYVYRIFVFVTVVFLLGALGLTFMFSPRGAQLIGDKNEDNKTDNTEPRKVSVFNEDKDIVHIMLLGVDQSEVTYDTDHSQRADTIMILSIDPKIDKVQLLSVPRDTYIKIKGYDNYKINAAYARGGIDLQVDTVEDFLDVDISHYITVNYDAVKELVDALGGIEVYTPEYKYTDPSTIPPLEIDFKEGLHLLNGEDSVKYLRIRKIYEDQDLDRIKAQQAFIMKVFEKMQSPSMILKLPKLISIANRHIETDMSYGELAFLAYYGTTLDKSDISMASLGGVTYTRNKIDYYKVDKVSAQKYIDDFEQMRDNYTEDVDLDNMSEEKRQKYLEDKERRESIKRDSNHLNSDGKKANNNLNDINNKAH